VSLKPELGASNMLTTVKSDGASQTKSVEGARCRLCDSRLEATFVDLGMSPLCENYLTANQLDHMEPYFPLHVLVCGNCFLVQLREYVKPDSIFTEYAYFSSYSTSWVEHARKYCHMIAERLRLGQKSDVFEIASNDGYLLQHFLALGVPVTGIEPAGNVADVAETKNIHTLREFFGLALAKRLVSEGRRADLIVGNNVLAQVPDINDFTGGMAYLLAHDGVITLEFPHLERLIKENQFDTIYHEHFSYFSLLTVDCLASRHGLKLFDVEILPTHGGSLRAYLCRTESSYPVSQRIATLLAHEQNEGFENIDTYRSFSTKVHRTKRRLLSFLIQCKDQNAKICGYGAPGKGNTLLNYCGIGTDFLDFTVDRNPYKHGRYTPGMHIPIRPVDFIDEVRPDYILILPWNLKGEIINQMRHVAEWGCKFVIPIPEVLVVDPREAA
jgi:C-methyltransferase C-terminal domain/Putative zinc binding domain/Methyltransferase domain